MLPPGITRSKARVKRGDNGLYLNGRDSTCPSKGYNAQYLYYPTKLQAGLSVIQLISSVIGTPMNILGPVPHSLPRRLVKTRVPAISRLAYPTRRSKRLKARTPSSEPASPKKPKAIKQALKKPHPAPARWRETYDAIKEMRSRFTAPVDTMGCDTAKWKEIDLRVPDTYR